MLFNNPLRSNNLFQVLKRFSCFSAALSLVLTLVVLAAGQLLAEPTGTGAVKFNEHFEKTDQGTLVARSAAARLTLGDASSDNFKATVPITLSDAGYIRIVLEDGSAPESNDKSWLSQVLVHKDGQGWRLSTKPYVRNDENNWEADKTSSMSHTYWPIDRRSKEPVEIEGIEGPRKFTDKEVTFVTEMDGGTFRVWMDGRMIADQKISETATGPQLMSWFEG